VLNVWFFVCQISGQGEWFHFSEGAIRDATSTLVNFLNSLPEPVYTNQLSRELHLAVGMHKDLNKNKEREFSR
jgi:hypothetical protein